jgi:hypothetical protein
MQLSTEHQQNEYATVRDDDLSSGMLCSATGQRCKDTPQSPNGPSTLSPRPREYVLEGSAKRHNQDDEGGNQMGT